MAPIAKLLRKIDVFKWIDECQIVWEDIKNWYIPGHIFINPTWELEFHVHTNAFQLVVGAILTQNPTCKIY